MKNLITFTLIFSSFYSLAETKKIPSTKERAASMFRSPSGGKSRIDPKFQPIDHKIKQPGQPKPKKSKP